MSVKVEYFLEWYSSGDKAKAYYKVIKQPLELKEIIDELKITPINLGNWLCGKSKPLSVKRLESALRFCKPGTDLSEIVLNNGSLEIKNEELFKKILDKSYLHESGVIFPNLTNTSSRTHEVKTENEFKELYKELSPGKTCKWDIKSDNKTFIIRTRCIELKPEAKELFNEIKETYNIDYKVDGAKIIISDLVLTRLIVSYKETIKEYN